MPDTAMIMKYELVIIVNARLSEDKKGEILKSIVDMINKVGVKVINSQAWLAKHRLTFAIKKCVEGTYYLVNLECDPSMVQKIHAQLKLNEEILRFAIFKAE